MDRPHDYKQHAAATPYLGGAGVLLAFVGVVVAGNLLVFSGLALIVALAVLLALLGTADDRRPLGLGTRFGLQALAASILWLTDVRWEPFGLMAVDFAITLLWTVGLTNSYNLLDNMDGATATAAVLSAAGIGAIALEYGEPALAFTAFALSGACACFLAFNLSSSQKIFLGDGGSMPIGFLVAALAMSLPTAESGMTLLAAIPLAGIAIFDTTLVVVSRRRRGAGVFSGARDHSTHRLLRRLGSPARVCALIAVVGSVLAGLSVLMFELNKEGVIILSTCYLTVGLAGVTFLEKVEPAREAVER